MFEENAFDRSKFSLNRTQSSNLVSYISPSKSWRTNQLNPYHLLVIDTVIASTDTPQGQAEFWAIFRSALAGARGKRGCPVDGLYLTTVRNKVYDRIARLPVPEDAQEAEKVFAFLEAEKCDRDDLLQRYRRGTRKGRESSSGS